MASIPLSERFWQKVDCCGEDECWNWTASINTTTGYGQFWRNRRFEGSHRIAWELTLGEIPDGLHVCHRCDNRRCCNPTHLFLGTARDNALDMVQKGRNVHPRGAVTKQAKVNEQQAREIRCRYAAGGMSMSQLAREYKIGLTSVFFIIHRVNWAWVEDE